MISVEVSENKLNEFCQEFGDRKFEEIKDKIGADLAAIIVVLHTSKVSQLMTFKDILLSIGWPAPVAVAASDSKEDAVAEPSEFELVITKVLPDKKIAAIKKIRSFEHQEASSLGLAETKGLIDALDEKPIVFSKYTNKDAAENDLKLFEGLGEAEVRGI